MSQEDSLEKRLARWQRSHDLIFEQLPVLLEKMAALFPTEKKTESSETENKSEAEKPGHQPALTPAEMCERYKDLEVTVRGFLEALDEGKANADEKTGGTSRATPPSVED